MEVTWFFPARRVIEPEALIAWLAQHYPPAVPTRFGQGDPPGQTLRSSGASELRAYWHRMEASRYFVAWTGSRPFLRASLMFPDAPTGQRPGVPVGSMAWYLDAGDDSLDQASASELLAGVASLVGAFYACAYVLDGWTWSRGVLATNVFTSQMSPVAATGRWLGIPPGRPWITWFGPPYREAVEVEADSGVERDAGIVVASPPDASTRYPYELRAELLAQWSDPADSRFPPDVSAVWLPGRELLEGDRSP